MPPDNREVRQPGQSTNRAARQELSAREIQERLVEEIRQIGGNELEQRQFARRLVENIFDADVPAAEQRRSTILRMRGSQQDVVPSERQRLKEDVVRVLKAVEQGVVKAPSPSNEALLKHICERVGTQVTDTNAAYLQPLIASLLATNQPIENIKANFDSLVGESGPQNDYLFQLLSEAVIDAARAGDLTVNESQAREMFESTAQAPEFAQEGAGLDEQTWSTYFRSFFSDDPEDRRVIEAMYSPEKMKSYIQERREKIAQEYESGHGQPATDDDIWRLTSEDVEREIVLRFSKLYLRVDKQRPNEPFEQIAAQGGLYDSIQIVQIQMLRALEQLGEKISRMSPDEYHSQFGDMKFFRRFSKQDLDEKVIVKQKEVKDAKGHVIQPAEEKTVRRYRIQPAAGIQQLENVQAFLDDVHTMVEHEVATRSYLHNVKLAFQRPAGQGGFWSGLAGYAEQMPATDIDSMMHLPDNNLFMSAYRLYVKYLEEEFALVDWRHQPNMFSPDFFNNKTAIEQKVRADLRRLFPELRSEMNWRLDRAMSMGIGLAKGVLLTEVEIAAYAEPHQHFENGTATFTSIYTNDTAATAALNPQHHFLRWQTESAKKGPLIFLPLIGMGGKIDKSFMRGYWDHRALWQSAQKFRDSYLNGQSSFKDRQEYGEMLFIDFMPNFGKVGGYFTRGGWRASHEIEGSLHYTTNEKNERTIDALKSWKALENVGYEALIPLVGMGEFKFTPELREYLFDKYINPGGVMGVSLDGYLGSLPKEKRDVYFVNHVFAHLLMQRIPTKLIRMERDRQSKDGVRAWERVRARMGVDGTRMNSLMQNLMMVESKVREETSERMNKALQEMGGVQDLSQLEIHDYMVDENRIRSVLQRTGIEEADIADTVRLHQSIRDFLLEGQVGRRYIDAFATQLKDKKFPFAVGVEEVDASFLALRAAGQRVLPRALGDTGKVETVVYGKMVEYINGLQAVSLDPKHDIHKMLHSLHEMHETIEGIHGHDRAGQIVASMASLTIAYFKKDTIAKNWLTRIGTVGRPNSLAAEFAGTFRGVWEWELGDIDAFITELERMKLLPKDALDLGLEGDVEIVDKKFLGVIPYKSTKKQETHPYLTGKDLRESFGASKDDIRKEIWTRYLPVAMFAVMYTLLSKAWKADEKK